LKDGRVQVEIGMVQKETAETEILAQEEDSVHSLLGKHAKNPNQNCTRHP